MPTRVKVKNVETGATVESELEADATIKEIVESTALYWNKNPGEYVLRKGRRILDNAVTIIDSDIQEGDLLEFVSTAAASKQILILENSTGVRIGVNQAAVLGRKDLKNMLADIGELKHISRNQLTIWEDGGRFMAKDGSEGVPSKNGTTLNGSELGSGKGLMLKDGDVLGIAGVLELKVRISTP